MIDPVPTVDQLVSAVLDGAVSPGPDPEPVEKTASSSVGVDFEKVAEELDTWANEAENEQEEVQKVASAKVQDNARDRIMKIAMVDTMYRTLRSLEENGQIQRLVAR